MARGNVGMEHAVMAAAQVMERVVDEQLAAMEDVGDDDLQRLRKERVLHMKKKKEDERKWKEREHGVVQDLPDEKAFFEALKGEERFVCHFYRENRPCKVSGRTEARARPTRGPEDDSVHAQRDRSQRGDERRWMREDRAVPWRRKSKEAFERVR